MARESSWTSKKSTSVECEATYLKAMHLNCVNGEAHNFTGDLATKFQQKLKTLAVKGKNRELAVAANTDYLWKSFLYDISAGTMKFLLSAAIDTLPSAANVKSWTKSSSNSWTRRHNTVVDYVQGWKNVQACTQCLCNFCPSFG